MKDRILKGWTFTRVMYTLLGVFILWQSIVNAEWLGILLGGYFASMGIFSFGCASGNCVNPNYNPMRKENNSPVEEVKYEEIK